MMQKYAVMIKNSGNNCSKNKNLQFKTIKSAIKKLFNNDDN